MLRVSSETYYWFIMSVYVCFCALSSDPVSEDALRFVIFIVQYCLPPQCTCFIGCERSAHMMFIHRARWHILINPVVSLIILSPPAIWFGVYTLRAPLWAVNLVWQQNLWCFVSTETCLNWDSLAWMVSISCWICSVSLLNPWSPSLW